MKVKMCVGLVLAAAVTTCLCRPAAQAPGDPRRLPASLVRRDWPQTQEQKHLMSQFLPHIFTELSDHKDYVHGDGGSEALHDHYYPDWMDFGRRSAEDTADAV